MLAKILSPAQDELLREERRILSRLKAALVRFDAAGEHLSALDKSIEQLDELFLLVIVGEFNAGKSAFINALVGSKVAAEGVTPTTAQINVLQYGDTESRRVKDNALHVITEHIAPGAWDHARGPTPQEFAKTAVLALRPGHPRPTLDGDGAHSSTPFGSSPVDVHAEPS